MENRRTMTVQETLRAAGRPLHVTELARHFNCTNDELRRRVRAERREGALICSGDEGYWIPETEDDLRGFVHSMLSRIKGTALSVKAAREMLNLSGGGDTDEY